MQWLIGSAALILSIILTFRFAETRRAVLATLGIIAILAVSAATLFLLDTEQSAERQRESGGRVTPAHVAIPEAGLFHDHGRWRLTGTLANNSRYRVISLTLHVRVKDCPEPDPCKVTGDTEATHYGMDVPPGGSQPFEMLLYLPDTPEPKTMQWEYEIVAVGAGP